MAKTEIREELSPKQIRDHQFGQYWAGDMARRVYLLRRQRKAILENCRRIAVVGASSDPNSASYVAIEKLLGLGLEIIPIFADRESFLGLRCFRTLRDVPAKIDILQVYPEDDINFVELAQAAVDKGVTTFWIEQGVAASRAVEDILVSGRVQLVEYESLEAEYLKHVPYPTGPRAAPRKDRKATKVKEQMSRSPATVKPDDGLKDAIWKMDRGHFRHLPVVDDNDKLIGMLSDRDIRLIRPSLAFVKKEEADGQLWSIAVQQAAVFDPVRVRPETSLREAADIMLALARRWTAGGRRS